MELEKSGVGTMIGMIVTLAGLNHGLINIVKYIITGVFVAECAIYSGFHAARLVIPYRWRDNISGS